MAYIQEKLKGKKIVSFKFKACVGRDDNGKQIFKCTTWYPPAELTPAKARKEAQKVAAIWEDEVRQAYLKEQEEKAALDKEKKMQQTMLQIKKKFGKNAILKGMNLLDGATAKERNEQIGGHKA